jgi:hypothetical protein
MLSTQVQASEQSDHPWSDEQHEQLVYHASETWTSQIFNYPVLQYPIQEPETLYSQHNQDTIPIFSYGSLLNKESAARTLSEKAMATHQSAVSFGSKRVFDRHVPTTIRWGPLERPNDTAMLNLNQTNDLSEVVNGVVIEVDINDLKNLLFREEGYDLVPVVVTYWDDAMDPSKAPRFFIAYTFQASDESREGIHYTNQYINPVPGYALASKSGAEQYGELFLDLWVSSTYLADKETPFAVWESYPEVDCVFDEGCAIPN